MKPILALILILLSVNTLFGQLTKRKHLERIKNSKIIVVTSKDAELSQYLYEAAKQFWTLSNIVDSMQYDKALAKIKEDKSYLMLTFGSSYSVS